MRNNGIHVKGEKQSTWTWKVLDLTGSKERCVATYRYQRVAIPHARAIAKRKKCELVIHGRNGKIRRKDSFGRDPRHVKG